ncbi:MAG: hypothetical protein KBT01_07825, partial [Clostridiales bacterium]|nr:hypothetical protein [Candidatus Blautia equi]
ETENGKLYISYPMIESIRDVSCAECAYKTFYIPVEQSPDYKAIANPDSDFKHYPSITREMWTRACKASINQASIMVLQRSITEYKTFIEKLTQSNIYGTQRTLFLEKNGVIVVLNALPMFLLEFYSEVFWNEVISLTTDAEATDCDL